MMLHVCLRDQLKNKNVGGFATWDMVLIAFFLKKPFFFTLLFLTCFMYVCT